MKIAILLGLFILLSAVSDSFADSRRHQAKQPSHGYYSLKCQRQRSSSLAPYNISSDCYNPAYGTGSRRPAYSYKRKSAKPQPQHGYNSLKCQRQRSSGLADRIQTQDCYNPAYTTTPAYPQGRRYQRQQPVIIINNHYSGY